jgi:hypothetical protein
MITGPIDERVVQLVSALNQIPAVTTYSSCGGHPNPSDGQAPDGAYRIDFDVRQNKYGWAALGLIADACIETDQAAVLEAWSNGGDLSWELNGCGNPNVLAAYLTDKSHT